MFGHLYQTLSDKQSMAAELWVLINTDVLHQLMHYNIFVVKLGLIAATFNERQTMLATTYVLELLPLMQLCSMHRLQLCQRASSQRSSHGFHSTQDFLSIGEILHVQMEILVANLTCRSKSKIV